MHPGRHIPFVWLWDWHVTAPQTRGSGIAFPDLASGLYKELCTSTEFLKVHYTGMSRSGDPTRTWWGLAGSVSGLGSSGPRSEVLATREVSLLKL